MGDLLIVFESTIDVIMTGLLYDRYNAPGETGVSWTPFKTAERFSSIL